MKKEIKCSFFFLCSAVALWWIVRRAKQVHCVIVFIYRLCGILDWIFATNRNTIVCLGTV